ncbi:hypothetical protein GS416_11980, partial [Rhodococcus hoagii]|nr:hypothetical protein [Prescottella equi]
MQGGTAATQDVFIEHRGRSPRSPRSRRPRSAAGVGFAPDTGGVQLVVWGRAHPARAPTSRRPWLWARMPSAIGTAALIALGDNPPRFQQQYEALGSAAASTTISRPGLDPAGITTQDPELQKNLDPVERRTPPRELPARADDGGADPRPRVRQVPPAQSRT